MWLDVILNYNFIIKFIFWHFETINISLIILLTDYNPSLKLWLTKKKSFLFK